MCVFHWRVAAWFFLLWHGLGRDLGWVLGHGLCVFLHSIIMVLYSLDEFLKL